MKRLSVLFLLLVVATYAFGCDMFAGMVGLNYASSTTPLDIRAYLLSDQLKTSGSSNPDGCGFVLLPIPPIQRLVLRSASSISSSPIYYQVIDSLNTADGDGGHVRAMMAHARKRTSGPTGGIHPFQWNSRLSDGKTYFMMHNGGITQNQMITSCMNAYGFPLSWIQDAYTNVHQSTITDPTNNAQISDSELIFYFIMGMTERHRSVEVGMNQALAALIHYSGLTYTSLNIILTDGDNIYAYYNRQSGDNTLYYCSPNQLVNRYSFYVTSLYQNGSEWQQILTNDTLVKFNKNDASATVISNFATQAKEATQLVSGLDWRCFPVMGSSYSSDTSDAVQYLSGAQQTNFGSILVQGESSARIWSTLSGLYLSRTKGYILNMVNTIPFDMKGTLTSWDKNITLNNGENWIGYFLKDSSTPMDALYDVIADVTSIQSQDWFMYKFKGAWYGAIQNGVPVRMNYGEMYKVTYSGSTPATFTYNYQIPPQTPGKQLAPANYFTYTELPAYKGVVIDSLDGVTGIEEVAVLKNGEVVGATKFVDYPVYIRAYTDDATDLDIAILTNSRAAGNQVAKLQNRNLVCMQLTENVYSYRSSNDTHIIYHTDNEVSPIIENVSVYPNPSRTNTTIQYSLSKAAPLEMSIYNVKGQLIHQAKLPVSKAGINKIEWNGKDQSNNEVGAGVYLCRIGTGNNFLTTKILHVK